MNIALFFGGKSCEHDISIITAYQLMGNISNKHKLNCVYVDGNGNWLLANNLSFEEISSGNHKKLKSLTVLPNDNRLYIVKGKRIKELCKIDAALLAFHGMNGEDGKIQGLLGLSNIPYTGCDVCSSAITMDKATTKKLLKSQKMPTIRGIVVKKEEYLADFDKVSMRIAKSVGKRLILKPCNLGSSIGISVCENKEQLKNGFDVAFMFDERCIVEVALKDFYELNCSVCRLNGIVTASLLEKPMSWEKFLTFDEKYRSRQTKNISNLRQFPYKYEHEEEIREMAKSIYETFNCSGVVRIDFLIDNLSSKYYVNEINSIPGSFAYYLWDGVVTFSQLIDNCIDEAITNFNKQQKIKYAYYSDVLKTTSLRGSKGKV